MAENIEKILLFKNYFILTSAKGAKRTVMSTCSIKSTHMWKLQNLPQIQF